MILKRITCHPPKSYLQPSQRWCSESEPDIQRGVDFELSSLSPFRKTNVPYVANVWGAAWEPRTPADWFKNTPFHAFFRAIKEERWRACAGKAVGLSLASASLGDGSVGPVKRVAKLLTFGAIGSFVGRRVPL